MARNFFATKETVIRSKYSAQQFWLTLQNESGNHEILSYKLLSLLPLISFYFPQYLLLSNTVTE